MFSHWADDRNGSKADFGSGTISLSYSAAIVVETAA